MNYRNLLCLALGLRSTVEDLDITMRLASMVHDLAAAASAVDGKPEGLKAFSARLPNDRDLIDAEVARQMGNSPAMIAKYGSMSRA